ncbi:MAG TPA: hypothetical protein VGQ76_10415 [Thermoanaerobaculia bacterium]|jgi:hypothetical protein|nr:hypothetical protein [Thermoanaerobaculia bacterium]
MPRKSVIVLVALLACAVHADDTHKIFIAADKQTQITVPESWDGLELNENAEIQVGNAKDEAYLIVLNELKADLHGWNIDRHSRVTLGQLLSSVAFPVITGPKSITVGGSPAIQYEIRGAAENRNVVYVHTTIDGSKYYSQILAWTLPSRAEKIYPRLMKAIATFREVD